VLAFSNPGCTVHTWQTVRAWSAGRPRGARQPAIRCVRREFLCRFVLIHRVGCFRLEEVCRTIRPGLPDRPRGSDYQRVGHRPSVFRGAVLVVQVAFWDCLS
jgi:hypothetical protein